jgi:hypothetical protein
LVTEKLEDEVDINKGINQGLDRNLILKFFGAAIVEVVESWILEGFAEPSQVVAEHVGILLDRNL